jgi:hypothetical protein
MAQELAYHEGLTRWFTREEIGRGLRELYEVPKELPPKLLALVRKLEAFESNQSPHLRRLVSKLDTIEGNYLLRNAPPAEPRSVGPSDDCALEDRGSFSLDAIPPRQQLPKYSWALPLSALALVLVRAIMFA